MYDIGSAYLHMSQALVSRQTAYLQSFRGANPEISLQSHPLHVLQSCNVQRVPEPYQPIVFSPLSWFSLPDRGDRTPSVPQPWVVPVPLET
jgi:hypothetical protein